jgi:hypothetical protein
MVGLREFTPYEELLGQIAVLSRIARDVPDAAGLAAERRDTLVLQAIRMEDAMFRQLLNERGEGPYRWLRVEQCRWAVILLASMIEHLKELKPKDENEEGTFQDKVRSAENALKYWTREMQRTKRKQNDLARAKDWLEEMTFDLPEVNDATRKTNLTLAE